MICQPIPDSGKFKAKGISRMQPLYNDENTLPKKARAGLAILAVGACFGHSLAQYPH
jgi:hypothetical protein